MKTKLILLPTAHAAAPALAPAAVRSDDRRWLASVVGVGEAVEAGLYAALVFCLSAGLGLCLVHSPGRASAVHVKRSGPTGEVLAAAPAPVVPIVGRAG